MILRIKILDLKFDEWNESHSLETGADYEIPPQFNDSISVSMPREVDSQGKLIVKGYTGPKWTADRAFVNSRTWELSEFSSAFHKDGEMITSHICGCEVTAVIVWREVRP